MSVMEGPPAIAGMDGPGGADQAAQDLQMKLDELDQLIWADRKMSTTEQRLLAAWFYMQKQKILAEQQMAQQAGGGPESFSPQQPVPGMSEEPLTAGAPGGGGGDSGYEDYQP